MLQQCLHEPAAQALTLVGWQGAKGDDVEERAVLLVGYTMREYGACVSYISVSGVSIMRENKNCRIVHVLCVGAAMAM